MPGAEGCLSGVRHDAFKLVFINHRGHCPLAIVFTAADNSPGTVDQYVRNGPNHGRRQHNAEPDNCSHWHLAVHMEENAARGDISGFGKVFAGITGADGNGKP